jgi:hypothetical protein
MRGHGSNVVHAWQLRKTSVTPSLDIATPNIKSAENNEYMFLSVPIWFGELWHGLGCLFPCQWKKLSQMMCKPHCLAYRGESISASSFAIKSCADEELTKNGKTVTTNTATHHAEYVRRV